MSKPTIILLVPKDQHSTALIARERILTRGIHCSIQDSGQTTYIRAMGTSEEHRIIAQEIVDVAVKMQQNANNLPF